MYGIIASDLSTSNNFNASGAFCAEEYIQTSDVMKKVASTTNYLILVIKYHNIITSIESFEHIFIRIRYKMKL